MKSLSSLTLGVFEPLILSDAIESLRPVILSEAA
jgi:hypothetical protein